PCLAPRMALVRTCSKPILQGVDMSRSRIAVAGAGYIGQAHVGVTQKSTTCTLSAIVDPAPAAETIAAEASVPLYRTLDELFAKDRPDGVILATPNQLQMPHALQ